MSAVAFGDARVDADAVLAGVEEPAWYPLPMADGVKRSRRPGFTRLSRKNQATIPVAVLAEAGIRPGDELRVEVLGPGRIALTRARDPLEDLVGTLGSDVYPEGYLRQLREEWR
jgi:bifunctional DNA-binding transcriptional regulator/antitoxin component of YhaV-PrlF toxin-antitoxin module